MPPPQRVRLPTGVNSLEWVLTDDGSRTLVDSRLDETFHSGCGAVAETLIVYLANSGALERLRNGRPTAVLEYGLGTATGFLLTAALAECYQTQLDYCAIECSLLPACLLRQLNLSESLQSCIASGCAQSPIRNPDFAIHEFHSLPTLGNAFCDFVASLEVVDVPQLHSVRFSEFVKLRLALGDARSCDFAVKMGISPDSFDAVYFDPFSPESNPGMWSDDVISSAANSLHSSGKLTSYCVKGSVRKSFEKAGLRVDKAPGPIGGKREVLVASKSTMPQASAD